MKVLNFYFFGMYRASVFVPGEPLPPHFHECPNFREGFRYGMKYQHSYSMGFGVAILGGTNPRQIPIDPKAWQEGWRDANQKKERIAIR